MKKIILSLTVVLALMASSLVAMADIKLPAPQTEGGPGLFDVLKKRSSAAGGDFSAAEVSLQDLSTVLWAAIGLNRGEHGWTVPMAEGLAPYCRVYVARADGVYLYDWQNNALVEISKENIKAKVGAQSFVQKADTVLIVVSDNEVLKGLKHQEAAEAFANVLTGAITQDIYLAAGALKLGARYIHSIHRDVITEALKLPKEDYPVCLMLLGK